MNSGAELNCDSVNLFDKLENIYSSCLSNSGSAAKEENGSTTTYFWWGGIHYIVIAETNVTNIFKMVQHDKICYYCAVLHLPPQEWNEEAAAVTIWLVIKNSRRGLEKKEYSQVVTSAQTQNFYHKI